MFLKIRRDKKAQLLLEYVILVAMAIIAIVAVGGIAKNVRDVDTDPTAKCNSFDCHFRQVAGAAGGVALQ